MTLTHSDYQCLMGFLAASDNAKEAEAWLQIWFNERISEVYKEGWIDACEYNGVEYDGYLSNFECGGCGCLGDYPED